MVNLSQGVPFMTPLVPNNHMVTVQMIFSMFLFCYSLLFNFLFLEPKWTESVFRKFFPNIVLFFKFYEVFLLYQRTSSEMLQSNVFLTLRYSCKLISSLAR